MATRSDARPLYEQVADELRAAIARGDLAPGDPVPSETELSERHGVSRQTVRLALQHLTQEGLVTSGRGRGRTVRAYAPLEWHLSHYESRSRHANNHATATAESTADQWAVDVREQGREPHQYVEVSIVIPPRLVAERLEVGPETPVVVRRRVRSVDGTPFQLADSYFREDLVRGTPLMEPRDVSAPGGLLAALGHPQARYRDEIRVRMPTRIEADRLELAPGTPVAEVIRTGYAEDGTPLRVMVTVAPGDRHILVYELDAS